MSDKPQQKIQQVESTIPKNDQPHVALDSADHLRALERISELEAEI